jgi:hypothetical protein
MLLYQEVAGTNSMVNRNLDVISCVLHSVYSVAAQRLVLAAAVGQARHIRLPKPLLACGASPQAVKPPRTVLGAHLLEQDTQARKRAFCSTGKMLIILPWPTIIAQRQAQRNRQNIR